MSEADDMLAELRGISVPPNMSNCRQFVDYLTRLASANRNPSSPDQLRQTIAHLSGALAEVAGRTLVGRQGVEPGTALGETWA